jgi:hypothetical protein
VSIADSAEAYDGDEIKDLFVKLHFVGALNLELEIALKLNVLATL